jgi:hypothetical protein
MSSVENHELSLERVLELLRKTNNLLNFFGNSEFAKPAYVENFAKKI